MLDTLDRTSGRSGASGAPERRIPAAGRACGPVGDGPASEARGDQPWTGAPDMSDPAPWANDWRRLNHELRTPLNAILGNIELLLDGSAGPLAAPVRACIGDLQIASRQLLRQLQPLLLLLQARTAEALASDLPIDLLALLKQAASVDAPNGQGPGLAAGRIAPRLPEGVRVMMAGDPVWLGVFAATMLDLHASSQAREPMAVALEDLGADTDAPAGTKDGGGAGVVLRASWPGLEPASLQPLALALTDAVLALHGGRIRSLNGEGIRLDLPRASVVQCSMGKRGHGPRR